MQRYGQLPRQCNLGFPWPGSVGNCLCPVAHGRVANVVEIAEQRAPGM
jgi:hypothetical protein